jgi:hypothetical protein
MTYARTKRTRDAMREHQPNRVGCSDRLDRCAETGCRPAGAIQIDSARPPVHVLAEGGPQFHLDECRSQDSSSHQRPYTAEL